MSRFQLKRHHVTRCGVNPDRVEGLDVEHISQVLDGSDLVEILSESDDEFVQTSSLELYHECPGENFSGIQPECDLRIGISCPLPKDIDFEINYPQDRVFIARCGEYILLGIANGHGAQRVAHELVLFIATEMPSAFFKSSWLTKSGNIAAAL